MSIIDGPKKPKPTPGLKKSILEQVPAPLALRAIREMEKATGISLDPAPTYLFTVEISGLIVALFTECSGIGGKRAVEPVREGGMNDTVHMFAGPLEFEQITLKRGLSVSRQLWDWFITGLYDFGVKRYNMSITQGGPGMNLASMVTSMFGSGVGVVKRWNVEKAFPVSWQMSPLNVNDTNTVAIESLVIAHEGISLSMIAGTPMMG